MKITVVNKKYEDVMAMPKEKRRKPMKQRFFWRWLMKFVAGFDLRATNFKYQEIDMDLLPEDQPCLVLMNHSSFIDLEIAAKVMYPKRYSVVCTSDACTGIMSLVMRWIGCIPTQKFVTDTGLIRNMLYAVQDLKSSVVLYPEASYSFDGTATPLPDSTGRLVKMLGVPVVMIRTYGAYTRDPLYNGLRRRKVNVSADVKYLLSMEEVTVKGADEINEIIREEFSFDNFQWQQDYKICVNEPFRAEGLNRVLYKCAHCETEGQMDSKGTKVFCKHCGKQYELTEYGYLEADDGETRFDHVPDWYQWERECVRKEIENDTYHLEVPVDICMMVNSKCIYRVGEGVLKHSKEGFQLSGCDGKLDYTQKPMSSYSLYSDYYWYEIGDVICIGDMNISYYCFPKGCGDIVAKTRLATEELYKFVKKNKKIKHK